jgi:hypothetical protein
METMNLTQHCNLYHLNVRTEKHGEEDVNAVDLNVSFEAEPDFIDALATEGEMLIDGHEEPVGWGNFLYHQNGSMRLLCLKTDFTFDKEYKDHTVNVFHGRQKIGEFGGATLCKIKASAIHGRRFEVTMQIQTKPTPPEMARLYDANNKDIRIVVKPPKATRDLVDAAENPTKEAAHAEDD